MHKMQIKNAFFKEENFHNPLNQMLLFNYPANSTKLGNAVKYILDFFFSNTEWIICKTDSQTKSIRLCFGNEASPSNGLSPARSIGTHYHFRQTCCSWKYWVRLIHKNKNWQSTSASLISCYAPALLIALLKQYELKRQMKKIIWLKVNYFYIHFIELPRGKIRVSKL